MRIREGDKQQEKKNQTLVFFYNLCKQEMQEGLSFGVDWASVAAHLNSGPLSLPYFACSTPVRYPPPTPQHSRRGSAGQGTLLSWAGV